MRDLVFRMEVLVLQNTSKIYGSHYSVCVPHNGRPTYTVVTRDSYIGYEN